MRDRSSEIPSAFIKMNDMKYDVTFMPDRSLVLVTVTIDEIARLAADLIHHLHCCAQDHASK